MPPPAAWYVQRRPHRSEDASAESERKKKRNRKETMKKSKSKQSVQAWSRTTFTPKSDYQPKVLHGRGEQSRTVLGPPERYHTAWALSLCDYSIAHPYLNVKRYFQKIEKKIARAADGTNWKLDKKEKWGYPKGNPVFQSILSPRRNSCFILRRAERLNIDSIFCRFLT